MPYLKTHLPVNFTIHITACLVALCSIFTSQINGTNVSGPITTNTTWTLALSPYDVTADVSVEAGVTLTIEAGVNVRTAQPTYEIRVLGSMIAVSNDSNPIHIEGASGTIGSVVIAQPGSSLNLTYVEFDNMGGSGPSDAALFVFGGAVVNLDHVDFNNSDTRGLAIEEDGMVTMNHCSFSANGGEDVYAHPNAVGLFGNTNILPMIHLYATTVYDTVVLPQAGPGVAYRVIDHTSIDASGKMTIAPGLEIQFTQGIYNQFFVDGVLQAIGTVGNPIRFVSVGPGNGSSVVARNGSDLNLQYVEFDSMGGSSPALRVYGNAVVNLNHVDFDNSEMRGLSIAGGAMVTMNNCSFTANGGEDVYAHPNAVALFGNTNTLPMIHLETTTVYDTVVLPQAGPGVAYRILGDMFIDAGGKMTIEPGLEIQFTDVSHEFFVDGDLQAIGTVGSPIRFIGVGAGYGSTVIARNTSNINLQYVEFDSMGGNNIYDAALFVKGGAVLKLDHVDFNNSEMRGLAIDENGMVTMNHCSFSANGGEDVYAHPTAVGLFGNTNFMADIYFHGAIVNSNCSWPWAGAGTQYVLSADIIINNTVTLDIFSGTKLLFPNANTELFINGTLNAIGTDNARMTFTGPNTLTYGASIVIGAAGSATIQYADFLRMGADNAHDAALFTQSADVHLFDCTFIQNEKFGIAIHNSATPEMEYLTFQENERGISVQSGSAVASHCNFLNNTFGVFNYGSDTVDARNNYWGHSSGPYHNTLNSGGSGDEVSDRVLFDPWQTTIQVAPAICHGTVLMLSQGIIPPGDFRYRDFIYAAGTATSPILRRFFAGIELELQAGFEVELGATFEGNIETCFMN